MRSYKLGGSCLVQLRQRLNSHLIPVLIVLIGFTHVLRAATPACNQSQGLPSPNITGTVGHRDPLALAEITAHLRAVGVVSWSTLQANGTLSYQDGQSHSASLYLEGSEYSRLDIDMGSGTRSVRVGIASGSFQDESGNKLHLLPSTARAGIVAFPRLWVDAMNSPETSLFDSGTCSLNGQTLHRITLEYQLIPGAYKTGDRTSATDLYLDLNTHLLVRSVDSVQFPESRGHRFRQVIDYGDYQSFDGVLIPTALQESLDDEPQWAMQLTQVTLNSSLPLSTFSF